MASRSSGAGPIMLAALPVTGATYGCVCAEWWRRTSQLSALSGRVPSCASVAPPRNRIVSPTENILPAAGLLITGTGGVLPASMRTVSGAEVAPWLSRTRSLASNVPVA